MQPAIWTNGPFLPKDMPLLNIPINPKTFAINVLLDNIPGSFTPVKIAFSYGIPLPYAYGLINYTHAYANAAKNILVIIQNQYDVLLSIFQIEI